MMGSCSHYAHEYSNGVWMGRLSKDGRGPVCWEPCPFTAPPPPPDGVVEVPYRCSRCGECIPCLGVFRYFPEGNGFFFAALDASASQQAFGDHLRTHIEAGESASLVPDRSNLDL